MAEVHFRVVKMLIWGSSQKLNRREKFENEVRLLGYLRGPLIGPLLAVHTAAFRSGTFASFPVGVNGSSFSYQLLSLCPRGLERKSQPDNSHRN